MYLLQAPPPSPWFKILLVDFLKERMETFRVKSDGKPYSVHMAYTDPEVLSALNKGPWDVVFTGTALGANSKLDLTPAFIRAFKEKQIRAVLVISSLEPEAPNMIKTLREAGVPAAWYPYNYNEPSLHIRKEDLSLKAINAQLYH